MRNFIFSLRYLLKARGNIVIRLVSLILGLGIGSVLFAYINYQFSFDRDLPDSKRIYKMYAHYAAEGAEGDTEFTYAPVAGALMEDCPQVEAATRIYGHMTYDYSYNENYYSMDIYGADTMFFDVFDFGVVCGDPKRLYDDEHNIMISSSTAKTLFGDEDPVGKVMQDQNGNDVYVIGVFNDIPFNTHLRQFDMLLSFRRIESFQYAGWNSNDAYKTYVKLYPGAKIADVEAQLDAVFEKNHSKAHIEEFGLYYFFRPVTQANIMKGTRLQYLYMFMLIGFLVIFVASMNYVLISISGLVNRSKTIAMLRCNGARKSDVFKIFASETLIIFLIAVVISVMLIFALQNVIENGCDTPLGEMFGMSNIWVTIVMILVMFLFAGMIPASMFSNIPLTAAFKSITDSRRRWKQALLCFQIVCISFVVFMMSVSFLQYNRLQNGDQGYQHDRLVIVNPMANYQGLRNIESELASMDCVEEAGTSYSFPIYGYSGQTSYDEVTHEFLFSARVDYISPDYLSAMGMELVSGNNLTEDTPLDQVLVNEKYVEMRGWKDSPIGHEIVESEQVDAKRYRVAGVVKNFRIEADRGEYQALVLHNIKEVMVDDNINYGGFRTAVRLREMSPENIAAVEKKIKQWMSSDNYHVDVYDNMFERQIRGEKSFRNVLILVCIITFVISLIGLIGYLNDEIRRRRKQIAVRKVNGAVMQDILELMARNVSVISLPSIAVGLVVGTVVAQRWLQQFSNCTPLYWWVYALSIVVVMIVIITTQVVRTWKIANSNPIDMLKSE